jgi:hypothetical protein
MATKVFEVTIDEEKHPTIGTDEHLAQLEASFLNIIEEINMANTGAKLKVTSVEEQT